MKVKTHLKAGQQSQSNSATVSVSITQSNAVSSGGGEG
jgi:hypothetical protein